jgi:hypothetical protein
MIINQNYFKCKGKGIFTLNLSAIGVSLLLGIDINPDQMGKSLSSSSSLSKPSRVFILSHLYSLKERSIQIESYQILG